MLNTTTYHACFNHFWLFVTLLTMACQAPLSMGFSRQKYWSRLPCSSPGESSWCRDWISVPYVSCTGRRVLYYLHHLGSPYKSIIKNKYRFGGSDNKVSACNTGVLGSIPRSGRSPGEGNGNPLQYSCLENPMDTGAGRATVHEVARVGQDLAT